ncbi:MAG: hypothetical protein M3146_04875 [Thermoproteota archaeon]|jgi:hypothetical protein|nr:hypothetical protein [Thermoproteota archaeon]MDQ4013042.1 hypothetical protein [Thermoproteota archaeon]HZA48243.1 hypothetical protein [Nitrososphaera sp.]
MAKTSSTKRSSSSAKYDIIINAKATTTKIIDITNETLRIESNDKGQVRGKHYSGVHWDTVEATMLADGSASLTIKYLHMTNKGESIVGTGTGTQSTPNQRGIARVTGEGTMWTSAARLSHLNGGRWKVEGEVNTIKETVAVRGNFEIASA